MVYKGIDIEQSYASAVYTYMFM